LPVETIATPGAVTDGWYRPMRSPVNARCLSSVDGSGPSFESSNSRPPDENDARAWLIVPPDRDHPRRHRVRVDRHLRRLVAGGEDDDDAGVVRGLVAWLIGSSGSKRRNDEPQELLATRMCQASRCMIMSS